MKSIQYILLFVLLIVSSCRFNKPLICIPDDHLVIKDSAGVTTDSKYFHYLNFHHCISIGGGGVERIYDHNGRLTSKQIFKAKKGGMKDGNNRYYRKTIWYDSTGNADSVHKYIHQNHGRGGKVVLNKTIVKKK